MTSADRDARRRKKPPATGLAAPGPQAHGRGLVAVLACTWTPASTSSMLGLEQGDAHIIRNAGGLVTDDVINSLSASQPAPGAGRDRRRHARGLRAARRLRDTFARRSPPTRRADLAPGRVRRHRETLRGGRPPALEPGDCRPTSRAGVRPGDRRAASRRSLSPAPPGRPTPGWPRTPPRAPSAPAARRAAAEGRCRRRGAQRQDRLALGVLDRHGGGRVHGQAAQHQPDDAGGDRFQALAAVIWNRPVAAKRSAVVDSTSAGTLLSARRRGRWDRHRHGGQRQ